MKERLNCDANDAHLVIVCRYPSRTRARCRSDANRHEDRVAVEKNLQQRERERTAEEIAARRRHEAMRAAKEEEVASRRLLDAYRRNRVRRKDRRTILSRLPFLCEPRLHRLRDRAWQVTEVPFGKTFQYDCDECSFFRHIGTVDVAERDQRDAGANQSTA
jgi:hypothetical protein